MKIKQLFHPQIISTIVILLGLTLPFVFTDLDLIIQSWFYHDGWIFGDRQPWVWLYRFGTLPGLILAIIGLVLYLGSWIWPKIQFSRRAAALIILTLVIGPGILVNVLGKGYWGRPRPREVTQFQGQATFHHIHQPGTPGRGKSFPSGHASVGFFLIVMAFVHRKYKWPWLATGITYGTLMGVARMAQGAHFTSDVIWAGGLTYLTAALLDQLILPQSDHPKTPPLSGSKKIISSVLLFSSLLLIITFFMSATPYYKKWKKKIEAPEQVSNIVVHLPNTSEPVIVKKRDQSEAIIVMVELQGFGFPKLNLEGTCSTELIGNTLNVAAAYQLKGYVTEKTGQVTLFIRNDLLFEIDQGIKQLSE